MQLIQEYLEAKNINEIGNVLQRYAQELSALPYQAKKRRLHEYRDLRRYLTGERALAWTSRKWIVNSEQESLHSCCLWHMPEMSTPAKTLRDINAFGRVLSYLTVTGNSLLTEDEIHIILDSLQVTYGIFEITASFNLHPTISRLDLIHPEGFDGISNYLIGEDGNLLSYDIFLFPENGSSNRYQTLYHEIAHLMIILSGIPVTSAIDILLDYLGFPHVPDDYTRGEILADVVATGLMYGGPYDSYNIFQNEILSDHYVSWCNCTQALMQTLRDDCMAKKQLAHS